MSRARQGDARPKAEIVLHRDIAAGEVFAYVSERGDDRVLIVGDIGAGAQVTVTAAEIEFSGDIGDGASVSFVRHGGAAGAKAAFLLAAPLDGLVVSGDTGHQVTLESTTGIRLRGSAGNQLKAAAQGDVRVATVGTQAVLSAGRDLCVAEAGAGAELQAKGRAFVTLIGEGSTISAGGIIGAKGQSLPYQGPDHSRDMCISPATTSLYIAATPVRLKRR